MHFEKDMDGVQPGDNPDQAQPMTEPDKDIDHSMNEVVDAQKRGLDQWCFAEHLDPNVLVQVGQSNI